MKLLPIFKIGLMKLEKILSYNNLVGSKISTQKQRRMETKIVKTKGENDCHECCFALACINVCNLDKGYHYIKVG